ncbi:hypothetical protein DBA29_27865 [Xenophilus aerolatus]|nr:hypothetical protein [Xenophilus aerolatus]
MKSQIWLMDPRPNLTSIVNAVETSFELSEASQTYVMIAVYPLVPDELFNFCASKRAVLIVEEARSNYIEDAVHAIAPRLAEGSSPALAFTKRSLNHRLRIAWPAFEHPFALEGIGSGGKDALEDLWH